MPATKPILCLDFDGVIHSYTSGWQGPAIIPDPPVPGAIAFILQALQHFDVVISSSRCSQKGGIAAMKAYLYHHGDAAYRECPDGPGLEAVRFSVEKPPAMVTIDDRALTFDGIFPTSEMLLAFKPWNKRDGGSLTEALYLLARAYTRDAEGIIYQVSAPFWDPVGVPWDDVTKAWDTVRRHLGLPT
jgi:hypothetical protein